jgi:hypothetical protein
VSRPDDIIVLRRSELLRELRKYYTPKPPLKAFPENANDMLVKPLMEIVDRISKGESDARTGTADYERDRLSGPSEDH